MTTAHDHCDEFTTWDVSVGQSHASLDVPGIGGEVVREGHEGEVEVFDVSWGIGRPPVEAGGSRRRSAANVRNLVVAASFDSSAPRLAEASFTGKVFDEVVLTLTALGELAHDYLVITMTNVGVRNWTMHAAESNPAQRMALEFETIRVRYVEQSPDGADGDVHEVAIDVAGRR